LAARSLAPDDANAQPQPASNWRSPPRADTRFPQAAELAPGSNRDTPLRLSREVVDRFKADGPGWQTRMDEAMKKAAGL
jgi:uncharacterized protein (DUF4415 family)